MKVFTLLLRFFFLIKIFTSKFTLCIKIFLVLSFFGFLFLLRYSLLCWAINSEVSRNQFYFVSISIQKALVDLTIMCNLFRQAFSHRMNCETISCGLNAVLTWIQIQHISATSSGMKKCETWFKPKHLYNVWGKYEQWLN